MYHQLKGLSEIFIYNMSYLTNNKIGTISQIQNLKTNDSQ